MNNRHLLLVILSFWFNFNLAAQCPGSLDCESAGVLCSIDALHGFTCNNPEVPSTSFPFPNLCFGAGTPNNLNWWAFIGSGGPLNLTFNFDQAACEIGQGIQAGVFEGDCAGSQVWDCNAQCNTSTFTLSGVTEPCQIYYVWVDGCNGDVCTYTMSVNGSGGAPSLPRPMPSLQINGAPCPGTTVEVEFPGYPNDCQPVYEWTIDGVPTGGPLDDAIDVNIPCNDPIIPIEICLTATIGNPNVPSSICDQDFTCTTIMPLPPEVHGGRCRVVCFEDQPVTWHGMPILSSCINPPCCIRTLPASGGCCVDSCRSFLLLPPPGTGVKDTFICDPDQAFLAESGQIFTGEICDELIEFDKPVIHPVCPTSRQMCDTSYRLSIGRLNYSKAWTFDCSSCSGETTLCPNIAFETDCPQFLGQVAISLVWVDSGSGDTLDVTPGDGCLTVNEPGTYCVYVQGIYRGRSCSLPTPECITLPQDLFFDTPVIGGDSILCQTSIGYYFTEEDMSICEYNWSIPDDQGDILTPMSSDSSEIEVDWTDRTLDETLVCLEIITDCNRADTCWTVYFDTTETLANDTILKCQDDSVVLQEPRPFGERMWSTGDTTSTIIVDSAGTYCVNGMPLDSSCETAKCFVVIDYQLTIVDTTIKHDSGGGDGSISVTVSTTETINSISWSNGDTLLAITNLEAGVYTLTITTESGCTFLFEFEVSFTTSSDLTLALETYFIAPNPGNELRILPQDHLEKIRRIDIFDHKGILIRVIKNVGNIKRLEELPQGLYFIRIKENNRDYQVLKWSKIN